MLSVSNKQSIQMVFLNICLNAKKQAKLTKNNYKFQLKKESTAGKQGARPDC
ncbi:hypothetical protein SAMN06269250_1121 [Spirosoma fluviale]|uniref:Uncharacterized protein n=1 Tax=Spirosoma fluviale TaxID=1597977 RepID=A0A286F9F8_9BACT|nr:hypothetical protein SAMN06269250_1121 [Spirosoma fluviale]